MPPSAPPLTPYTFCCSSIKNIVFNFNSSKDPKFYLPLVFHHPEENPTQNQLEIFSAKGSWLYQLWFLSDFEVKLQLANSWKVQVDLWEEKMFVLSKDDATDVLSEMQKTFLLRISYFKRATRSKQTRMSKIE